jgi:hypothetical protein
MTALCVVNTMVSNLPDRPLARVHSLIEAHHFAGCFESREGTLRPVKPRVAAAASHEVKIAINFSILMVEFRDSVDTPCRSLKGHSFL